MSNWPTLDSFLDSNIYCFLKGGATTPIFRLDEIRSNDGDDFDWLVGEISDTGDIITIRCGEIVGIQGCA